MVEVDRPIAGQDHIGVQVGERASDIMIGKDLQRSDYVTNIYGDPVVIKDGTNFTVAHSAGAAQRDTPQLWERVVALSAALLWFGLVGFLVVRNQSLDANLVVLVRVILSLMAGVLGAMIPGILLVGIHGPGFKIRAGGALALFVISYFFTPEVML